jgi:protein-L-isoaspartate(D-aspartate) O-methyltransferase
VPVCFLHAEKFRFFLIFLFSLVEAYNDNPVSLGHGQTISAPHMHAYALEFLQDCASKPNAAVLDVGCGSGYMVALFAELNPSAHVEGIEIVPELVELSRKNLTAQNAKYFENGRISISLGNGWKNIKSNFYDCIHVGAAAETLPEELVNALKDGGQMIIPVGSFNQELLLITKVNNSVKKETLMGVRYVPLVKERE